MPSTYALQMHISMILKYKLKRRESGFDSIAVPITAAFLSFICLVAGKQVSFL